MTDKADGVLDDVIESILQHPREKAFRDLRDRMAYVHVTGTYPSHLRPPTNRLMQLVAIPGRNTALDHRGGTFRVHDKARVRLNLTEHPMVTKAHAFLGDGYRIVVSRGASTRMPYTKVFLSRGSGKDERRLTVQIDGSVLDHW